MNKNLQLKKTKSRLALGIGLALAMSFGAQAQSDSTQILLKTVTKEIEKNISPSKTNKIITYSDEQLEAIGQRNIGDLLSRSSSVFIKSYGSVALSTPSVRGTGASQTQVYWNGLNVNSPTLGQTDLSLLPSIFFNQAALHLGSSSNVDGSGSVGGSIRLDNNTIYKNGETIYFNQEIGSFRLNTTGLKIGVGTGKIQSNTTLYNGKSDNDFSFKDTTQNDNPIVKQTNNKVMQMGLGQDLAYRFGKNQIEFKSLIFASERGIAPTIGLVSNARQEDVSKKFMLSFNRIMNKSTHTIKTGYILEDMLYENPDWFYESKYNTSSFSGIYNGVYYLNDAFTVKTFLLHQIDNVSSDSYLEDKSRIKSAAYVMGEHKVSDKLIYHVSVRQEYIDSILSPIAPSAGIKYEVNKFNSIALNGAKTFRVPTLNDLYYSFGGNPSLLPEEAFTGEFSCSFKNKKMSYKATLFYAEVDNWIQWAPNELFIWEPQNIKKVQNKGLELNLSNRFIEKENSSLDVGINYSYTESVTVSSEIEGDLSIGNQLIYVPKNVLNINLNYAFKGFVFNYMQTLTDNTFTDDVNENSLPAYSPADATFAYTMNGFTFGIRVQNIFNQHYQAIQGYPLPGRSLNLSLKFKFNS